MHGLLLHQSGQVCVEGSRVADRRLFVKPDAVDKVTEIFTEGGESVALLGEVIAADSENRVVYNGHLDLSR